MLFLILENHLADGAGIENILEDEDGWYDRGVDEPTERKNRDF
jgi:hypothetical protein